MKNQKLIDLFNSNCCSVPACKGEAISSNLCEMHYRFYLKNGSVTPGEFVSIFDPNDFILKRNFCEIVIRNKKGENICHAFIDREDVNKCKRHKWYLNSTGYITTKLNGVNHFLHQLVLGAKNIDHINLNKLDNRKSNLRKCEHWQNSHNRPSQRNGKSKYKGVWFGKANGGWCSAISVNGERHWCGKHDTEEEAALAYNKKAKELVGEFARLNEV